MRPRLALRPGMLGMIKLDIAALERAAAGG
jgi:hypothetical protein